MSERVEKLCMELSLTAVAHHYATLADEAVKKKRSYIEYLEQCSAPRRRCEAREADRC